MTRTPLYERPLCDSRVDTRVEVDLDEYLSHRRALPGLFDFGPGTTDPAAWAAQVLAEGEPDADVLLLLDEAERHLPAAVELASTLRRDVYLTPLGAVVRFEHESSPMTGDSWEAVAVDQVTGEPARWIVVRPADLPDALPTWFASVQGRLRRSTGLVTLALPEGLAFPTRSSFAELAQVAAQLAGRQSAETSPGVSTIAVGADLGRFEIGRFNDVGSLLGGVEFATLVAASLDVVAPDVQLALRWPTMADARAALDEELVRFADALNRTVWVPQPGGAAVADHAGFAAIDQRGEPCHWWAYQSRLATDPTPRYATDGTGRLVPVLAADARHPVGWLPAAPVTNAEQLDLYVWTADGAPGPDGRWTAPSAEEFVLAGEDPARLAARTRSGHLLRLRAPRGTAVDLLEHAPQAPAQIQRRILDLGATRLLSLPQLAETSVTGRLDLDGTGAIAADHEVPAAALAVRFSGAEHGVPGLPNDAVAWPAEDQRADTPAYAVLPGAARDGFVALSRHRPDPEAGQQVLEVKVRRRRVVDVAASVVRLAGTGADLAELAGVDLALPMSDLGRAVVTKVWSYVDGAVSLCKLDRGTLADHLVGQLVADADLELLSLDRDLAGVR